MKKLVLLSTILFSANISAETYRLTVTSNHIDPSSIAVRNTEGDIIPTCTLPEILNESKNACINPIPECTLPEVLNEAQDACIEPIAEVGWIYTNGDNCNGMRQSNFDPNVYFARSRSSTVNTNLQIPQGYRWLSRVEYANLFNQSTVSNKNGAIYPYYRQCGLGNYPTDESGNAQYILLFSDNGTGGMHTGNLEHHGVSHYNYAATTNFAGYVLYKEN